MEKKELKKGIYTTEFWLSLIAMIVGAIMASSLISNDYAVQILGIVASAFSALGYAGFRSYLKKDPAVIVSLPKKPPASS